MSTDRTTEMLNYLSAIARDVGEFRAETNGRLGTIEARLDKIELRLDNMESRLERVEREQRSLGQTLNRVAGMMLVMRSDVEEMQDRVGTLESKQA